ncbi:Josephin-domain-containing protein [Violaceomyces palustris]|uniref:Josephin-domain-containing protein n=1 Tax=Violaceomyces palustris TaxID=1673888 RepID=A0ACD0P7Z7_9BASI|nr:Josephin-domain-containing protein [Violaceomyces palustris]
MSASQSLIPYIHHERQEPGSMLCAQHALNALLQGNYYDPSQLADIANDLDVREQSELGLSSTDVANRERSSLNMDDTGFFSVTVLEKALQVWSLSLTNWRSEEMRDRQSSPENERAFVLNLESHWFTIRAFGSKGNFWYNLNSFLPQPSWVGKNYLGSLLHAAETEGYSVFVVHPSPGSVASALNSSSADEMADTLPPPGTTSSASASAPLASQGLRPNATSSHFASIAGVRDEEAELEAALRASLANSRAPPSASSSTSGHWTSTSLTSSAGQRRARSGSGAESVNEEGFETDQDIDSIAPTRQRVKNAVSGPASAAVPVFASSSSSSSASSPSANVFQAVRNSNRNVSTPPNLVLPQASGGRRRASRMTGSDDEDEQLRRAMEASLAASSSSPSVRTQSISNGPNVVRSRRGGTITASGSTLESAIRLDSDEEETGGGARRLRNDFNLIYNDEADDTIEATPSRSPFLNPLAMGAGREDDDVEEIESEIEDDLIDDERRDPFSFPGAPEASSLIGPTTDRAYDDEDAELQAALAASLGDESAAAAFAASASSNSAERRSAWESFTKSEREKESPTPADVDKISKMREEARRKEREERDREERIARGENVSPVAEAGGRDRTKQNGGDDDDDEEEEEEEEEGEEQVSPEEMRRRRLARFGG